MVQRRAVGPRGLLLSMTMFAAACASGDATPQGPTDDTPGVGPVRIVEKFDAPANASDIENARLGLTLRCASDSKSARSWPGRSRKNA